MKAVTACFSCTGNVDFVDAAVILILEEEDQMLKMNCFKTVPGGFCVSSSLLF